MLYKIKDNMIRFTLSLWKENKNDKESESLYQLTKETIQEWINSGRFDNSTQCIKFYKTALNHYNNDDFDFMTKAILTGFKVYDNVFIDYLDIVLMSRLSNNTSKINYGINPEMEKEINSVIDSYKNFIRIKNNHEKLSKKFNISCLVKEVDEDVEYICSLIDTYNIPVLKKIILCIEEYMYLYITKFESIDDLDEVVQEVVEYFLALDVLKKEDSSKLWDIAQKDDSIIKTEDLHKVFYLFDSEDDTDEVLSLESNIYDYGVEGYIIEDYIDTEPISDIINKYKANNKKDEKLFEKTMKKIYAKPPEKILEDLPSIFSFLRKFGIAGTLLFAPVLTAPLFLIDYLIEMKMKRKESEKVYKFFKSELDKVEKKIDNTYNEDKKEKLEEYAKNLRNAINKLEDYKEDLLSDDYKDRRDSLSESTFLFVDDFYSEYKNIKIKKIIEELISLFEREIKYFTSSNFSGFEYQAGFDESKLDNKDLIIDYLSADGDIMIPFITIYKYRTSNIIKVLTTIMETFNSILDNDYSIQYVKSNQGYEIILQSNYSISFDRDNDIISSYLKDIIEEVSIITECAEQMSVMDVPSIFKPIYSNLDKLMKDDMDLISYCVLNMDQNHITEFVNYLESYRYELKYNTTEYINDYSHLDEAITDIRSKNFVLPETEYQKTVETFLSYNILEQVVHELKIGEPNPVKKVKKDTNTKIEKIKSTTEDKTKEVKGKIKDINEKNEKKKVSLFTNLDLAMNSLKGKAKNLSTKEKEVSRNLDVSVSNMRRHIEKALTSDRREAIIRGSIIPSFSKCIKIATTTGAVFLINPVIAVIGSIGALAATKSLNDKERQMLLEEIEVELKVVEKQISSAESSGSTAKYRNLLQIQRKLQREEQRLRYRLNYTYKKLPSLKEDD